MANNLYNNKNDNDNKALELDLQYDFDNYRNKNENYLMNSSLLKENKSTNEAKSVVTAIKLGNESNYQKPNLDQSTASSFNNSNNDSNTPTFDSENADVYSMRDVNSTSNLLGLEESNGAALSSFDVYPSLTVPSHQQTNFNNKFKNVSRKNSNNQVKQQSNEKYLINSEFNSQSQSSIDTRYVKDIDSIPLVHLNNNSQDTSEILTSRPKKEDGEKWYVILLEVLFPFFIAGFGMVAAGVVLDIVQHWELFVKIPAIFTLIPALLGLKGNLEMTLASRFSTQVNIGLINDKSTVLSAVLGNVALNQAQAIIVGFLASFGALILKLISDNTWDIDNGLVIIAGSMSTASFASLILGGLMMAVIMISKKLNINPDNIATPIAASLGDLVTLTILAFLCSFLYQIKSFIWIHILSMIIYAVLVPVFIFYSSRNEFVKDALYNGWVPIIMAMAISSSGGFIMTFAVQVYKDIAVFQPVVNGVGGNLVAIFASRLSTALHRTGSQGTLASWAPKRWYLYPYDTFFGKLNPEAKTSCVLAALSIPGHLLFFYTITRIKLAQSDPINPACQTASFVLLYFFLLILQVLLLLLVCYWLVHLTWRLDKNPDNVCIPYLTAIGDLIGTAFLAICFHLLYIMGETRLRNPH